jgi:hypothetical protein
MQETSIKSDFWQQISQIFQFHKERIAYVILNNPSTNQWIFQKLSMNIMSLEAIAI